ncbi:ATP-grasp domain-containing protein [Hyaloraphidium curvatum]|nr:ATP-grasp domain-containing protein [Hyaloraphidium curvatum]
MSEKPPPAKTPVGSPPKPSAGVPIPPKPGASRQGSFQAEYFSHRTYLLPSPVEVKVGSPTKPRRSSLETFGERFAAELDLVRSPPNQSPILPEPPAPEAHQFSHEDYPLSHVSTFVFISPNFPPVVSNFARALRERGITVLGIGDAGYETLDDHLKGNLTEYYKILTPGGLNDYDECLKACGYFTWKYGRIHRIESFNETWLPLESRLRQDLNVPGLLPPDLILMRTKSGMRDLFTSHNIANPGGIVPEFLSELMAFVHGPGGVGYPLVIKPDTGVGAVSTHKIGSDEELKAWWDSVSNHGDYIAQHFISAPIVTFDGLASRSGDLVLASSIVYSSGIMEAVNEHRDHFFYTTRCIDPVLFKLGEMIVKDVLGLRERWFHCEFFMHAPGKFTVLEANLRPPGVFIPDMMRYAAEVDVYANYTSLLVPPFTPPPLALAKHTVAHVIRRTANIQYRRTKAELEELLGDALLAYKEMPYVFQEALGQEGWIVRVDWEGDGMEAERAAVEKVVRIIQEHA